MIDKLSNQIKNILLITFAVFGFLSINVILLWAIMMASNVNFVFGMAAFSMAVAVNIIVIKYLLDTYF